MRQQDKPALIGCVDRMVDRHVRNGLKDKEALVEVGGTTRRVLTYGQLHAATVEIAKDLRLELGGSREPRNVALIGSGTLEFVCAWLAVMRAGHIAFLIHPNQPEDHYEALWDQFDPALVVGDRTANCGYPLAPIEEAMGRSMTMVAKENPNADLEDARPALCLLSSGSTGLPKICVHAHRAFARFERDVAGVLWGLKPNDRIMGTSGPYFSFGLQGIHPALCLGATSVLVPEWQEHTQFLDVMEQERVSVSLAVPTLYHLMLQRAKRSYRLQSLRLSLSAGERLPPVVRERWQTWSGSVMVDSIGTTETFLPYFSQKADGLGGMKTTPGFDYEVTALKTLGDPGETVHSVNVSSPGMMLGYYSRWSDKRYEPLKGYFETQDLFHRDDQGWHFVSRNSERIKIAGYWVSPQELEEFLLRDPRVAQAGAVPIETSEGLNRLRAFVVLRKGVAEDSRVVAEDLIQGIKQRLRPKALCPDKIMIVPLLHTTATGKIRRGELKAMAARSAVVTHAPARANGTGGD